MANQQQWRGGGGHQGQRQGPPSHGQGDREHENAIQHALKNTQGVSYIGKDGKLDPAWLDRHARTAAEALKSVNTAQLRRFFGQASTLKRRLDTHGGEAIADSEVVAALAIMKASSAYSAARNERENLPLVEFMVRHANSVTGKGTFKHFHRHFEAVIAFHRVNANQKSS